MSSYEIEDLLKQHGMAADVHPGPLGYQWEVFSANPNKTAEILKQAGQIVEVRNGKVQVKSMKNVKTKAMGDETPGDDAAAVAVAEDEAADPGVDEVPDDEPAEEKFSAQILRRIHEHHSLLMQEYDELAQMNEHEEIGEFVTKLLGGIEETLTAVEELFEKHHGDLPPIEGAMGEKDMEEGEEATEADSEEEELPTPDEVIEGMETKGLRKIKSKSLTKVIPVTRRKDMTKDEADKIADDIKKEAADTEEKHLCSACKAAEGELTEDTLPGDPGTDLGDEETQVKSWLDEHKPTVGDSAVYLKGVSETQDFNDDSRHEAYHHGKMLDKMCKAFPQMEKIDQMAEVQAGKAVKEIGSCPAMVGDKRCMLKYGHSGPHDATGYKDFPAMDEQAGACQIQHPHYKSCMGAGSFLKKIDQAGKGVKGFKLTKEEINTAIIIRGTTDMLLKDGRVVRPLGSGEWEEVDPKEVGKSFPAMDEQAGACQIQHPHYKSCMGAGSFLKELSNTHDFGDPHREKALTWHKELDAMSQQDDAAQVGEGDNPVPLGEMQEKGSQEATDYRRQFSIESVDGGRYYVVKGPKTPHDNEFRDKQAAEEWIDRQVRTRFGDKSIPEVNGEANHKSLADAFLRAKEEQDAQLKQMKDLQAKLAAVASKL